MSKFTTQILTFELPTICPHSTPVIFHCCLNTQRRQKLQKFRFPWKPKKFFRIIWNSYMGKFHSNCFYHFAITVVTINHSLTNLWTATFQVYFYANIALNVFSVNNDKYKLILHKATNYETNSLLVSYELQELIEYVGNVIRNQPGVIQLYVTATRGFLLLSNIAQQFWPRMSSHYDVNLCTPPVLLITLFREIFDK